MRTGGLSMGCVLGAACLMSLGAWAAPEAVPATGIKPQVLQKATAISLGNMAWEGVKVSDVHTDSLILKWLAETPTGKWHCQSQPDGSKAYCER